MGATIRAGEAATKITTPPGTAVASLWSDQLECVDEELLMQGRVRMPDNVDNRSDKESTDHNAHLRMDESMIVNKTFFAQSILVARN
ncbi:hypothetical protein L0F63_007266, partial [Massospora cicadina]